MGRKSKRDEELVMSVINKSWQLVYDILHKTGRSMQDKEMVAMEVMKRTAPKNITLAGDEEKPVAVLVKFLDK
uniref:Uncharacterized protein n=1 Tax=uncultured marine virus TaxID=186617 RepID=A0A0F7L361_9VIRU|nr:hypothetical protein [uncultured marine virus]